MYTAARTTLSSLSLSLSLALAFSVGGVVSLARSYQIEIDSISIRDDVNFRRQPIILTVIRAIRLGLESLTPVHCVARLSRPSPPSARKLTGAPGTFLPSARIRDKSRSLNFGGCERRLIGDRREARAVIA